AQNLLKSRQRNHRRPHLALASEVKAAARPSPNRQVASTGSSWWLIMTSSAVVFTVVATYPPSGGTAFQSMSCMASWLGAVTVGLKGCSTRDALDASWVSRVKMRGMVWESSV